MRVTSRHLLLGSSALLALGLCACVHRPPAVPEPAAHMQPAAEQALPRRRVSQPLDPREAEPNRPWCRRTCRHLDGLASGPGADEAALERCTAVCRTWASAERIRCILEAESAADARECAW